MAKSSAGPAAAGLLLLFLAACSAPASAASTCPYSNTSEPFPADWNWLMWGPYPLTYGSPDVQAQTPAWLTDAMQASQLFTINTSLTFGSFELKMSSQLPEGPYYSAAYVYNNTVLPEEVYGEDLVDGLIPDDGTGLAELKKVYLNMLPGSHLLGIFSAADYTGMNLTQPTTLVGDSVLDMGYTGFGCASQQPRALTFSSTQIPDNFSMQSFEDMMEVLPSLPAWMGNPDKVVINETSPAAAIIYQYWPLVVEASGEPIPLFLRFTWMFDSEEEARQGVNSTGVTIDVSTWFVDAAEDFQEAGLDADSEQVHADLALVLNRLNDTLYGVVPDAPTGAPVPAPQPAYTPSNSARAGTASAAKQLLVLALLGLLLAHSF